MHHKTLVFLFLLILFAVPITAQDTPNESDEMTHQAIFYTYHQASGNRIINGTGTFPNVISTDYAMGATPTWLLASNRYQDGQVIEPMLTIQLGQTEVATLNPLTGDVMRDVADYSAEQPLVAYATDDNIRLRGIFGTVPTNVTVLSIDDGEANFAYITDNGELAFSELPNIFDLNIQPDAKVVLSDDNRLAVYADATNERYVHAIMGDDLEGSSLVVLQYDPTQESAPDRIKMIERIDLEGDAVYEGLSPIWADVNGDGVQDLIATVSDSQVGSQIRAYLFTADGLVTVDGQPIGQSNRWQHQLAWGAFGVNGEMQLVDVRTPHIGGTVRFYEFDGATLSIVSQINGYTSHLIGSRNLDMAVAGDFDGDGQPEIVLPSQDRRRIAGIANTANGAQVIWELPVDGVVATNLASVQTAEGLLLAVGRTDGTIRVWTPQN